MGTTEDKRKRFELLIKQGEVPANLVEPYFLDGVIEQVETSRNSKDWRITVQKETLVPAEVYRTFCLRIQEKMGHIAKIKFVFRYGSGVPEADIVQEYWGLFLEWAHREIPSVNGWMTRAKHEVEDGQVLLPCRMACRELARKKQIDAAITRFFGQYFDLTLRVKMQVGDNGQAAYEEFEQRKREEEREVIEQIMSSMEAELDAEDEEEGAVRLQVGYDIKDQPVSIQEIRTKKKITIQGTIFGLDRKELETAARCLPST